MSKAVRVHTSIEGTISFTGRELAILREITGYDLGGIVYKNVTHQFREPELREMFQTLHSECERLLKAASVSQAQATESLHQAPVILPEHAQEVDLREPRDD